MELMFEALNKYITGADALVIVSVVVVVEFMKEAVFRGKDWFKKACPYIVALLTIGGTVGYGIYIKEPAYEYIVKGLLNTGLSVFGYDAIIAKLKATDLGEKCKNLLENLFKKKA